MRSQPRTFIWAISDYFLPSPLTFLSTGNLCIHVQMGKLDHKEGWVPKNRCFCVLVLQKTRRVPWQKGDQTSRSYRKSTLNIHQKDSCWTEAPILWPPEANSWLVRKKHMFIKKNSSSVFQPPYSDLWDGHELWLFKQGPVLAKCLSRHGRRNLPPCSALLLLRPYHAEKFKSQITFSRNLSSPSPVPTPSKVTYSLPLLQKYPVLTSVIRIFCDISP